MLLLVDNDCIINTDHIIYILDKDPNKEGRERIKIYFKDGRFVTFDEDTTFESLKRLLLNPANTATNSNRFQDLET